MNQAPLFDAQFFAPVVDGVAVVAAAYRLHTFLAGTTTNQATYQDQAGATPNANPIILDDDGRCALWLDPAVEYKIELRDTLGATVRTWDDVVGTASTTAVVTSVNGDTGAVVVAAPGVAYEPAGGFSWLTATNTEDGLNQIAARANAPTAGSVTIEDAGNLFTATTVEGALAEAMAAASVDSQSGRLLATRYYTATGTVLYAKPTTCASIVVEMVGGGAASSGLLVAGSSGGYTRKRILVADLEVNTLITIGTGGSTDGAGGGTTSFGTHCQATGGSAGGGVPGVGVGGDLNLRGGYGGTTHASSGVKWGYPAGGGSFFGGAGGGPNTGGGGNSNTGVGGGSPGLGGSGLMILYEYS